MVWIFSNFPFCHSGLLQFDYIVLKTINMSYYININVNYIPRLLKLQEIVPFSLIKIGPGLVGLYIF